MKLNRVSRVDDQVAIRNVIISVADKRNLEVFVPGLLRLHPQVRIYSTGGTFETLSRLLEQPQYAAEKLRSRLVAVSDYTGQPEMQGGLVKTLDFRIYLGLLSETYNDAHQSDLKRTESITFDLVVVNLYPFQSVTAKEGTTVEEARANIDIGGPTMLRAAAKNFLRVVSCCSPDDYGRLLAELAENDARVSLETRFAYAAKTFRHTAEYDRAIADYLAGAKLESAAYVLQN
jgi:phosphoribosylaminoimidazolecarboxamide formyltransferase / IMP cyclohydrolase